LFLRLGKSLKKAEALLIAQDLQQAENELARGDLTRDRLTELFNETLKRLGESPVQRITVREAWSTVTLARTWKDSVTRDIF